MSKFRSPAIGSTGPKAVLSRKAPSGTREERKDRDRSRSFFNEGPRRAVVAEEPEAQKLQKVLASHGRGSRREIEQWIAAGRVAVNGEPAHLGQRVTGADNIEVDGQPVSSDQGLTPQVILLNKAGGLVCSRRDPEGRGTIFDQLPKIPGSRWVTVGRLDVQTTGLLLVTNDGGLAHRMMHPSTGLDREYAVRVNVKLDDRVIRQLKEGVELEGQMMRFSDIRYYNGSENNFWYHVALTEGRNREVRRLFESAGCMVSRLKRVRYGPVILPSWLTVGQWASLQQEDLKLLYKMLGLPRPGRTGQKLKRSRVAKGSCLIPYPKLEAPKSAQKPEDPSIMAAEMAVGLDFDEGGSDELDVWKERPVRPERPTARVPANKARPVLGKYTGRNSPKGSANNAGKTTAKNSGQSSDRDTRKTGGKVVRKNSADNRAGSARKIDALAKARSRGKANAATSSRPARSGKPSTRR
jgi:23S rRNA pseudouridine2605 synthase